MDTPLPSRRDLLKAAAGFLLAPALVPRARAAAAAPWTMDARVLGVVTLAVPPEVHGGAVGEPDPDTAVLDLDLATGAVRYHSLPDYRAGHSMLPLPGGGYFVTPYGYDASPCLFLGPDFQVLATIEPGDREIFGGHSVLLPGGQSIVAVTQRSEAGPGRTASDTGDLVVIDVASRRVARRLGAPMLAGHDVILLRDGEHLVVADDGSVPNANSIYEHDPYDPAFLVYRCRDLELVRKITLGINGAVVHIEEGPDGRIYGGVEQILRDSPEGMHALWRVLGDSTVEYVTWYRDKFQAGWSRSLRNRDKRQIVLPSPLVICDPRTGEVQTLMRDRMRQLDAFDTAVDSETGSVFTVSVSGESLLRVQDGAASMWDTPPLKVERPFGLLDLPGGPYMAVNGYERGVAVFDTRTMQLARHFDVRTYGMKHMILASG